MRKGKVLQAMAGKIPTKQDQELDPWGNALVDYEKLFARFGLQKMDAKSVAGLKTGHRLFSRGIVFAHRDFDKFSEAAGKGRKVAAMSGIKPSNEFHLGSKLTAEELIYYQKEFGAKVFYAIADLEAHADNGIALSESRKIAVSNVADLLALGLDEKNAYIYRQSRETRVMNLAYVFSKKVTDNTLRAIYGERDLSLYMSVLTQAGDILMPQLEFGMDYTLVPVGVDQDPHIRLTRDIAAKLGVALPAATYHRFMKSLSGTEKMSKRNPKGVITLADRPEEAEKKVLATFTGGRATEAEQRRLGGEIDKCVVYDLSAFHFENDADCAERKRKCLAGEIMCGPCKREVAAKVRVFLEEHQRKKEKQLDKAEKILEMQD